LGFRRQLSEIPDDRGQHILPWLETTGDIHRFITPMMQIAARRAEAYQLAVDIQLVAIIGGDMNEKRRRGDGQIERAPEMVDAVVERRFAGNRNPMRAPGMREQLRIVRIQDRKKQPQMNTDAHR
jgi:hypothetical protein